MMMQFVRQYTKEQRNNNPKPEALLCLSQKTKMDSKRTVSDFLNSNLRAGGVGWDLKHEHLSRYSHENVAFYF